MLNFELQSVEHINIMHGDLHLQKSKSSYTCITMMLHNKFYSSFQIKSVKKKCSHYRQFYILEHRERTLYLHRVFNRTCLNLYITILCHGKQNCLFKVGSHRKMFNLLMVILLKDMKCNTVTPQPLKKTIKKPLTTKNT